VRKLLVLRQFHIEGFVNTYRQVDTGQGSASPVFESEAFENFSNSWKARESYEFLSDNEFIETFELAAPGKPFQVYSSNHFKRVQK
jgi:transglutaminase/protease-like cytokinesis protein 3